MKSIKEITVNVSFPFGNFVRRERKKVERLTDGQIASRKSRKIKKIRRRRNKYIVILRSTTTVQLLIKVNKDTQRHEHRLIQLLLVVSMYLSIFSLQTQTQTHTHT